VKVPVTLLAADLRELAELAIEPEEALRRGAAELGRRPIVERLDTTDRPEESLAQLAHAYAEMTADFRMTRFDYASNAPEFARLAGEYGAIDDELLQLQDEVIPSLKARLRELRTREAELERLLSARGVDAAAIGPSVRLEDAIDTRLESEPKAPTLGPPAPRPALRRRLLALLRRS
jgi:hypothetical protein